MGPIIIPLLLLAYLFTSPRLSVAAAPAVSAQITVEGAVYCDVCYSNTFTTHSYFLQGVDVELDCKFKANSPGTAEVISFSVNRTTNKYGVYELVIPAVDGIDCVEGPPIQSACQATLIKSTSSACDVAGLKTSSNEVTVKSKQANLCIYCLEALSFRPSKRDANMCGNY